MLTCFKKSYDPWYVGETTHSLPWMLSTGSSNVLDPGKFGQMWCHILSGSHTSMSLGLSSPKGIFRADCCASKPDSIVHRNQNVSILLTRS